MLNLIVTAVAAATLITVQPADTEPDIAIAANPGCVDTDNCVVPMPDGLTEAFAAAILDPEWCGLIRDISVLLPLEEIDSILTGWTIYLLEVDGRRFTDAQRSVIAAAVATCAL